MVREKNNNIKNNKKENTTMNNIIKDNTIKIDKIKTCIPYEYCKLPDNDVYKASFLGFSYVKTKAGLVIEISGKLFVSASSLGYITKENYKSIAERIYSLSGVQIDSNYLVTMAPTFRTDVCEDVVIKDNPLLYISELRQILKRITYKYNIYMYKDCPYKKGFTVIPNKHIPEFNGLVIEKKTLSSKTRFSVYIKGAEIKKAKHREYRKHISDELYKQTQQTIRFELELKKFKDIRKHFGINSKSAPVIQDLFKCQNSIIADVMSKIIN